MPTLKVARRQAASATVLADFGSVWCVADARTVSYEGQGVYSYVGGGEGKPEDTGFIKTKSPLDPNRNGGIAGFEVTLTEPG